MNTTVQWVQFVRSTPSMKTSREQKTRGNERRFGAINMIQVQQQQYF